MHAYAIERYPGTTPVWADNLAGVRAAVKVVPRDSRLEVRIDLLDIEVQKSRIVEILNGTKPKGTHLRRWRLSNRGKLIEIKITDD